MFENLALPWMKSSCAKELFKSGSRWSPIQSGSAALELCPDMYATWAVPWAMTEAYFAFDISAAFSSIQVPTSAIVDRAQGTKEMPSLRKCCPSSLCLSISCLPSFQFSFSSGFLVPRIRGVVLGREATSCSSG